MIPTSLKLQINMKQQLQHYEYTTYLFDSQNAGKWDV